MAQNYLPQMTQEQRESSRRTLVFVGCVSIFMIFAGLTSAYIVSKGGAFWVGFPLPTAFFISTVIIVFSSIILQIAVNKARKGNGSMIKFAVPFTLLCGILFAVFQFLGYSKLVDNGAHVVSKIITSDGRYGDQFELKINGKYMEVDGNEYLISGKPLTPNERKELSSFAKQFDLISYNKKVTAKKGIYDLLYQDQVLAWRDGKLFINDTTPLQQTDLIRLESFMCHLRDGRGDFFHKGKYGKDFWVSYQGKRLDYKNRELYLGQKKIDGPMQLKASVSADQATTYLYILTFIHLLHIVVTLIYFTKKSIHSFSGRISQYNYLGISNGALFWHFLGGLWLFLLCFLLFIH
jgi:cytochrome c oxidase subunit III